MATYVPAKKNTQYIFYVGLVSQANTKVLQSNPTIAAGDFKVSTDGGALANLGTLPVVTPASSKMVKITLSAGEMNGDNITVICSDAAGAEWCDLLINIQTSARQVDDLTFPNTSGRGMDVDASGGVEVGSFQADAITAAAIATGAIDADALAADVITDIWQGTALTEAYAADGAAATPAQLLYMIWSALVEFAISGTTITCKKLNGSTTAMTFTLDSSSAPTSRTRAT